MKCPYCNKVINENPNSPESLLFHIQSVLNHQKGWIKSMNSLHGDNWLGQSKKQKAVDKWQSWYDWVKTKIEEDVS